MATKRTVILDFKTTGVDIEKRMKNVGKETKKTQGIMSGAGKKIGKSMLAVGVTVAGVAVAVGKLGIDFEQSFAKVSTLFGDVNVDVDNLKSKILELSSETGVAAGELNEGLYQALSAGVPVTENASEAIAFMAQNVKLAKAGFTDTETAIDTTTSVINAYGMEVTDVNKISEILIKTQNAGKTTIGELGSSISNVTPTAAAMGVSFEQVGAALATMTAQGIPTAQATTQLNQLFAEMGKSGTKASDAFKEAAKDTKFAGQSFSELMAQGVPLTEVLGVLEKSAAENNLSMIDMFSSIEAGKSALAITSGAEGFNKTLENMTNGAGELDDAFKKVTETTGEKMNKMLNALKNEGIKLFVSLQPLIEELVSGLMPILTQILTTVLPPLVQLFSALLKPLLNLIEIALPPLIEILNILMEAFLPILEEILPPLIEVLAELFEALMPILIPAIKILAGILKTVLVPALKIVMVVLKAIVKVVRWVADILMGALKPPINFIIKMLNVFIKGLNKIKVPKWVPKVGGKGLNIPLLPTLAVGTNKVNNDGFAELHKGEAVVPADVMQGGFDANTFIKSSASGSSNKQIINVTIPQTKSPIVDLNGRMIGNIILPEITKKIRVAGGGI